MLGVWDYWAFGAQGHWDAEGWALSDVGERGCGCLGLGRGVGAGGQEGWMRGAAPCREKLSLLPWELVAMGGVWLKEAGAPGPITLPVGLCQGWGAGGGGGKEAVGAELPGLAGGC